MNDETRALRHAALLLLLASVARWGWRVVDRPDGEVGPTVLPELIEATRDAASDEERRSRPLGDDERIDPNTAAEADLDRLPGVGRVTARAIVEARDAGVAFRVPEDLSAVRGIGPSTVERLRPHLDLRVPPRRGRQAPAASGRLDLNRASAAELESLPGVGPAIAARIVERRREQPFLAVDDLIAVRGIGPATLERLRSRVSVGPGR